MQRPRMEFSAAVLGAKDAATLARFYQRLLGWEVAVDEGDWVMLRPPEGRPVLSFQSEPDHVPPAWPAQPGAQQMMIHLDIGVEDLEAGVAWAIEAGATLAENQPQRDVRVMLDPAGHPFCLFPVPFDD
jgi:catechol-2,3-dioxygenase